MSDYALIFIDLLSSPINSKPFQGYLHTNRDMKTFFDIYFAETDVYLLTGSKPNCKTKQKKRLLLIGLCCVTTISINR